MPDKKTYALLVGIGASFYAHAGLKKQASAAKKAVSVLSGKGVLTKSAKRV